MTLTLYLLVNRFFASLRNLEGIAAWQIRMPGKKHVNASLGPVAIAPIAARKVTAQPGVREVTLIG